MMLLRWLTLRATFFMFVGLAVVPAHLARAQDTGSSEVAESPLEVRNAVGGVLVAGLVGGILGLSTLSFYNRPQDHIKNIFFGAGGAMIAATLFMTFTIATSPIPNIQSTRVGPELLPASPTPPQWALAPVVSPQSAGVALFHSF